MKAYMLDTNICSYIIKGRSDKVLEKLEQAVQDNRAVYISSIVYAELRYGEIGKKAPKNIGDDITRFVECLNDVLPWSKKAVDESIKIRKQLAKRGTPIGSNAAAIAGHAIAENCIIVTNNRGEFDRVAGLEIEDWSENG